jgi:hypothetical protein
MSRPKFINPPPPLRYPASYAAEREATEAEEARQQVERVRAEDEARQRHLAKLEAERAALRAAHQAELEREIAPERERAMRSWLADHAGKTEQDFTRDAWPHLRLNVLAEREQRIAEANRAELLARHSYF